MIHLTERDCSVENSIPYLLRKELLKHFNSKRIAQFRLNGYSDHVEVLAYNLCTWVQAMRYSESRIGLRAMFFVRRDNKIELAFEKFASLGRRKIEIDLQYKEPVGLTELHEQLRSICEFPSRTDITAEERLQRFTVLNPDFHTYLAGLDFKIVADVTLDIPESGNYVRLIRYKVYKTASGEMYLTKGQTSYTYHFQITTSDTRDFVKWYLKAKKNEVREDAFSKQDESGIDKSLLRYSVRAEPIPVTQELLDEIAGRIALCEV
jgi:hypothetical protein